MIEVLLATTILVFATAATLTLYDGAWKLFKKGENAVEQQQTVRAGFGKLSLDLQMAGFNHNPDGDASRPDEPIEAAFDTAIVVRADFDAADPALAATPEAALGGGAFDSVSIGNDEIVAYVLAKPDGSSTDTLVFEVDVEQVPRDGAVETVSIGQVALVHDDPPYNLYRITLNNDVGTWGLSTFVVRTLVAQNVRSLSLRYLDDAGGQINSTFDLTTTSDDIGGGEGSTQVQQRSRIRRIELDLVGQTRDPDRGWSDTHDSNPATREHRKFQLKGDVTLRNGGMVALPDLPS
jgi:hypothetical protein